MRTPFLRRSREETPSSWSVQERAPCDKYKSSWCRYKVRDSPVKNAFGIFGGLFFCADPVFWAKKLSSAPKIPKEFLISEALNLHRHQLDLCYLYRTHSCTNRELGVSSLDRHKNELRMISISLVDGDLTWRHHFLKKSFGNFGSRIFAEDGRPRAAAKNVNLFIARAN